jgi:repressor LexA
VAKPDGWGGAAAEERSRLTERQQKILDFITDRILHDGHAPTIREIGEHMGIRSTNGVSDHIKALKRKGYLSQEEMKSRTLMPVDLRLDATRNAVRVPIVGRVAAGAPVLAQENIEDTVYVDSFFVGNSPEIFALRVRGDSMIEDGIFDGDYIFVRKQLTAERGETLVVMVDGDATVKRFFRERDHVRLEPANSAMQPIIVRSEDFRETSIIGKVVGVYRRMAA